MQQSQSKIVLWSVRCPPPRAMRYCKKCGRKTEYISSGKFRINAQRKSVDIWLIYKCERCDTTWNSVIYTRVSPHYVGAELLERFRDNDESLAMQYAMDTNRLCQNGAEHTIPTYEVDGAAVSLTEPTMIRIHSQYPLPIKVSSILKKQLGLSAREFDSLLLEGYIRSETGQDLRKCKLLHPLGVLILPCRGV